MWDDVCLFVTNNFRRREGLFKVPKHEFLHAPLVAHIIGEVFRLPLGLREGWITWGFRSLIRKATAMIIHADSELYASLLPLTLILTPFG